jgi:mRNA interferase MazF
MRNPARQVRRSTPSLRLARGDIWLVRPARPSRSGHPVIPDAVQSSVEATPCVVLSPNELNDHLRTVIVAPVRSASIDAPFRAPFRFRFEDRDTRASIALDQLRTVDRQRLVKRVGRLSSTALNTALSALQTMFAP